MIFKSNCGKIKTFMIVNFNRNICLNELKKVEDTNLQLWLSKYFFFTGDREICLPLFYWFNWVSVQFLKMFVINIGGK